MKKVLLIVVLAVFAWTGSMAQVVNPAAMTAVPEQPSAEYADALKKYMEVSGSLVIFKNMVPQLFAMFKKQFPNVPDTVWEELEKEVTPANLLNDVVKAFIPAYQKLLSLAELNELITFYKTPLGQKLAKTQPVVMQGSMQIAQQVQMPIARKVQQTLREKGYIPTQPGM